MNKRDAERLKAWARGEKVNARIRHSPSEIPGQDDSPGDSQMLRDLREAFSEPLPELERQPEEPNLEQSEPTPEAPRQVPRPPPVDLSPSKKPTRREVRVIRTPFRCRASEEGPQEPTTKNVVSPRRRKQRKASQDENWGNWEADLKVPPERVDRDPIWKLLLSADRASMDFERDFSIGLDAGTSGIRVAVQNRYRESLSMFDFGDSGAGSTRFSLPALVALSEGRFRFGEEAVKVPRKHRFMSFKAGVLFPELASEMKRRWEELRLPYSEPLVSDEGAGVAELLFCLSLAKALEDSCPRLMGGLSQGFFANLQLGAPLDSGDQLRRARFERLLLSSCLLAGGIGTSPEIDRAIRWFSWAWGASAVLATGPEEEKRYSLRPEAQAILGPLWRFITPGENFLVADIGATSTEVSVSRVGTDGTLYPYASRSLPIGVDLADRLLLGSHGEEVDMLDLRRSRHEHSSESPEAEQEALQELALQLKKGLRAVLYLAAKKDKDQRSWEKMSVVVAGGGSNIPILRRVFEEDLPHPSIRSPIPHPVQLPDATVVGKSRNGPDSRELPELVCVAGCATPEGVPFKEVELGESDPTYEDPLSELDRWARSRWV